MPPVLLIPLLLLLAGGLYGFICYALGPAIPLLTMITIGLPIFLYLSMEWFVTPLIAIGMGAMARYHPRIALVAGLPLVILYTWISPVVGSGLPDLNIPVPWLAVYARQHESMLPILKLRLGMWLGLFTSVYLVMWSSRLIWALPAIPQRPRQLTPRARMIKRLQELKNQEPK